MCSPGGAGLLDIKPDLMESLMQVAAATCIRLSWRAVLMSGMPIIQAITCGRGSLDACFCCISKIVSACLPPCNIFNISTQ